MFTLEIPRDRWTRFFDDFSRPHAGWIVALEVLGSGIGDQEEATGLPLVGISADLRRHDRIEVTVGGTPEQRVTHVIDTPRRVWLTGSESAGERIREAVEIESEDGTATLVRFWYVPPEQTERQLPEG